MGKRIAIASCYDKYNYGSLLQSFALQQVIEGFQCDVVTLDKSGLSSEIRAGRRSYYRQNLFNMSLYRAKMGFAAHRIRQKVDKGFGACMRQRYGEFRNFSDCHIKLSPQTRSFRELASFCSDFDAVVVGSDQLWLPVNIAGGYYTLSFVDAPVRKVSYATSFGVSDLPARYLRLAGEFLESFDAVSVREETGSCIVKNATGRAAEVVCDPTMLLTKEEWCSVKALDYRVPSEPYILCYFMGTNIWNRYCAEVLARNRGCKILAIVHPDEYVAFDEKYANYKPYDVGPAQFLQLVSHAKYICTDSFHGTVFATLFNKQFFSFRRHENLGSQSTNSRLDTLLSRLGLESRLCESVGEFDSACCEDVDFDRVNAKVESFRLESLAWLRTSLGIEEPFDDMH